MYTEWWIWKERLRKTDTECNKRSKFVEKLAELFNVVDSEGIESLEDEAVKNFTTVIN